MKTIDFVVRESAGGLQRGEVSADTTNQLIVAGAGQEISINARQSDFASQVRTGDQLVITLSDGRTITIDNFFNEAGPPNRLFVSADGYLNEVSFVDAGEGNLFAQYGPTAEWGKWSPSDELIFLGNTDVAGVPLGGGEVSQLGAGLLGGAGFGGAGAALVAGIGGIAAVGALTGGSGDDDAGPAAPFVNESDANVVIGGDDVEETITVSGGGEPGDTVTVTIGDEVVETVIGEDGTFEAVFEGDTFPEDGVFDSVVTVTNPGGEDTVLDGPSFEIDTTAPEITFTSGVDSVGDFFNGESFEDGVTITGTGEAGAALAVTIAGVTQNTVVAEDGTWSAIWDAGSLEGGEFTTEITAVATDSFGNSATFNDTLVVDTLTTVTVFADGIGGDGVVNGVEFAQGVEFTGSAEAGSSVEVTVGGETVTVIAAADGSYSATFTPEQLVAGEYDGTVSVVATDTFGNVATADGSFEVDTLVRDFAITSSTGGADGVINPEELAQPLIVSGTTEPGSTVTLELDGTTVIAQVASDGSWTATFEPGSLQPGSYTSTITATATDAAGNVDTATTTVQVDTEAGLLTIDSTPVEGDDIVNAAEASDGVVITGTADPGALVTVTLAGVSRDVVADADGTWQAPFAASEIEAGDYTAQITATTTDPFGNTATASDSVQVDTRVDNLTIDAGNIAGDNIISASEYGGVVTITGTTEVGSQSVVVTLGGVTIEATGASTGSWSVVFDADVLPEGTATHAIDVVATDRAGNQRSESATVQVDTEVSPFTLTSDPGGRDDVVNAAEAAGGIVLGGSIEAGSTVTVVFDGVSYDADVNASAGTWSLTVPADAIREGQYTADIRVEAQDLVGNVATITDTLAIDTQAPDGPIVTSLEEGRDVFFGLSVETVMENGQPVLDELSVVQVASNGAITDVEGVQSINNRGETEYSFDAGVPDGSHLIINATDDAGNTSGTYLVQDVESDQAVPNVVDLSNVALGEFQIENLDLDFSESASVVIDEASLLALSTATNTLTIRGSAEDQVTIEGGQFQSTQTVDGETFRVYSVGNEGTLLIENDITAVLI